MVFDCVALSTTYCGSVSHLPPAKYQNSMCIFLITLTIHIFTLLFIGTVCDIFFFRCAKF